MKTWKELCTFKTSHGGIIDEIHLNNGRTNANIFETFSDQILNYN